MKNSKNLLAVAIAGVIGASLAAATLPASAAKMEKCYGVVKKEKNDCGTKLHACASQAKVDGDPSEWVFLPKGTCKKIVNGSLKSGKVDKKKNS